MLSQYMTMLSNPEYPAPFELPEGLSVKALGLNCGAYDLPGYLQNMGGEDPYLEAYFCDDPKKCSEETTIMPYLNEAFPPSYVMTSYYDFLRQEAQPFYEALKEKGVKCEYHLYGNESTPEMIHVFHTDIRLSQAWECNEDECRFFREVMEA